MDIEPKLQLANQVYESMIEMDMSYADEYFSDVDINSIVRLLLQLDQRAGMVYAMYLKYLLAKGCFRKAQETVSLLQSAIETPLLNRELVITLTESWASLTAYAHMHALITNDTSSFLHNLYRYIMFSGESYHELVGAIIEYRLPMEWRP